MTNPHPAADTGLPTATIIAVPTRRPPHADFEPDVQEHSEAFTALALSWQFAHLDDAGMDRAVEEMVRTDRREADRMLRDNAAAIRWLYEATDFLIDTDNRLQESLSRVMTKLEAHS